MKTLSIIIPVYNEELLIEGTIKRLTAVDYPSFIENVEFVIINDASTDGTENTIDSIKSNWNSEYRLIILQNEKNSGKGKSVWNGIAASHNDIILIQDADLELVPEDIPSLLNAMNTLNIEFVNGSRYLPGIVRPIHSYKRYFFNKKFTRLASVLINTRLTDLACGYKLFSRDLYDKLSLKEKRFGFEAELIIKVARLKRTLIAEVPVSYFPRNIGQGKKLRNTDGLKIFWVILKYGLFRMG